MNIELTEKEFRFLLDLVYIGNWVLNATREGDRIEEYDRLEEKIFARCDDARLKSLISKYEGRTIPSRAYEEGGIHEAISDYEDAVFFEILAEELARRDMSDEAISQDNLTELTKRVDRYLSEFENNGVDNISVDTIE